MFHTSLATMTEEFANFADAKKTKKKVGKRHKKDNSMLDVNPKFAIAPVGVVGSDVLAFDVDGSLHSHIGVVRRTMKRLLSIFHWLWGWCLCALLNQLYKKMCIIRHKEPKSICSEALQSSIERDPKLRKWVPPRSVRP